MRAGKHHFIAFSLFISLDFKRAPVLRCSMPFEIERSIIASDFLTASGDFASFAKMNFFDSFTKSFTRLLHMRLRDVLFIVWRRRFAAESV